VDPADRGEEVQVVTERAVAAGQVEQHGCARVLHLVDGMPEPGDETAVVPGGADDLGGELVPAGLVPRALGARRDGIVEEPGGVLGHAEEPGSAPEQPGGDGPLQRLGRAGQRQAGREGGRGEAVVGEGHEHGLEQGELARRRAPLGDEPVRQLAEADLAEQVGGQVLAQQRDRVGRRRADAGAVRGAVVPGHRAPRVAVPSRSQVLISSLCSPSSGGGSS
jgi:hypothetical protein